MQFFIYNIELESHRDRFTVYFDFIEDDYHGYYGCIGMSENPFNYLGFCQHSSGLLGKHNGRKISFENLPFDCQKAIIGEYSI